MVAVSLAASMLATSCTSGGDDDETARLGELAELTEGVPNPLAVACRVGVCVADRVVLPAGQFVASSVDLPMPEPLALLNLERVWLRADGENAGVFGPGWWSWLDLRIDDGELRGPAPSLPVSKLDDDGDVTFADGSTITWSDGRVVGACPAQGYCVDVQRDDEAILLTAVGSGRSVRLTLRGGVVVAAQASDGRSIDYRYADGRLAASEGLASSTASYGYAEDSLVVVTDRLGVREVAYLPDGRVGRIEDRDGDTWEFDYEERAEESTVTVDRASGDRVVHEFAGAWLARSTNAAGDVLVDRTFDADGLLATERLPADGITTTWRPDGSSEVRRVRPEGGPDEVVRYSVDELGRLVEAVGTEGTVRYRYVNSTSRVASMTRGGAATRYEYDSHGLLTSVVDPDGYGVSLTRDDSGLPVEVDDGVRRETFAYGPAGEVLEQASGSVVTSMTYSDAGELQSQQSGGAEQRFRYDDRGRLVEVADEFGAEQVRYDDVGRVIDPERDAARDADAATRRLHPTDQVIEGIDAPGGTFADDAGNLVAFDRGGRIVAVESPVGVATRKYDQRGDVIALTYPDGRRYTVERSAAGRPTSITDARDQRMELSWHGDRLTGVVTFAGVEVVYRWNEGGQLAGIDLGPLSWTYTYDPRGYVERATTPHGEIQFEWTPEGLPIRRVAPSRAITEYDWVDDLLRRVLVDGDELLAVEWDDDGRVVRVDTDGVDETFEYDDDGRLSRHRVDGEDTSYTYDDDGRVVGVEQGSVTESWRWTGGTVTEVRTGDDEGDAYALAWLLPGQLSGIERAGAPVVDVEFDDGGRLTAAFAGEDAAQQVGSVVWSSAGLPRSIVLGDDRAELAHDADGIVVSVEVGGSTYAATYEDGALAEVTVDDRVLGFDAADGVLTSSTFGDDDASAELIWAGGDRLATFTTSEGSGALRYDATGRVVEIAYDDRVRPVRYGEDGSPSADGTGGELLSDLFGDDGRFALVPDDTLVEPAVAALATLPAELGIDVPRVVDPAEYIDAYLAAQLPMTPGPIIGDRTPEEIARQTLLTATGVASTLTLQTGPATAAQVSIVPGHDSLDGLLDDSVTTRAAGRILDRLGPDASIWDRVTGVGQSAVGGLGSTFSSAWRFVRDNPVTAAVLTVTFLVSHFIAIPAVAASALSVLAFVDPSDVAGSLTAILLEPIRAVSRFFDDPNLTDALIVGSTALALAPWMRAVWGRYSCSFARVVCVSRSRFGEAAQHIDDAVASGHSRFLTADAATAATRRSNALRGWARVPGFDLDEYPPAFTRQGGTGASVRAIDPAANRALGAYLRGQLPRVDGYRFLIRVVA